DGGASVALEARRPGACDGGDGARSGYFANDIIGGVRDVEVACGVESDAFGGVDRGAVGWEVVAEVTGVSVTRVSVQVATGLVTADAVVIRVREQETAVRGGRDSSRGVDQG